MLDKPLKSLRSEPRIFGMSDFLRSCKFCEIESEQFLFFLFKTSNFLQFTDFIVSNLLQLTLALIICKRRVKNDSFNFRCNFAQDFFTFPNTAFKNTNSHETTVINLCIDSILSNDIVDINRFTFLSASIDTTNSLFNAHWVPWKIIVDHHVAELIVKTF